MTTDIKSSLLSSPAFAGAASGLLIGVSLQPLEIIKVCLIMNPAKLALLNNNANFAESFFLSARFIYQLEGLKGFWRGLTPALLRIGVANSAYFHCLDMFNRMAAPLQLNKRAHDFGTSSAARVISTLAINPLTMLKTRMELPGDQFNYKGVGDAVSKIYKTEGMKAFFKGAQACMFRDVPFAGLYYAMLNLFNPLNEKNINITMLFNLLFYHLLQKGIKEKLGKLGIQSSSSTMVSGMIAGFIATTSTHPFEVIRTHLQLDSNDKRKDVGIFRGLNEIRKNEGTLGLFKGLQARLMRKPLSNALTFTFFELFQNGNKKDKKLI